MSVKRWAMVLLINLLLIAIVNTTIFSQIPSDASRIFRIEVSECKQEPTERRQTGFLVNDENVTGIVTALHGVADCAQIRAVGLEAELSELQLAKVDIDRDMALLWSKRIEELAANGLEIEVERELIEGNRLSVIGYPVNLGAQLPTRNMTLRGKTELINLVPDNLVRPLYKRQSPNLGIQVLSIEGHLLPGHSGAPIFDQDNRLIGVGNGGLDFGRTEISWAIPWPEINWKSISPGAPDSISSAETKRLNDLREGSLLFFSFVNSDTVIDEIVEKTACISTINAEYESLNELTQALEAAAKRQAVGELFGEFLMAYTQLEDYGLSEDQIRTFTTGYIRVAGNPRYKNHETNLGEVCVSIEAFVTPEDRRKLEPVEITSGLVCALEDLPGPELRRVVENRAVIRALLNYDRKLEVQDENELLRLMKNRVFSGRFDEQTGAYCTTVRGEVLPIEVIALIEGNGFLAPPTQTWSPAPTPTPLATPTATPIQTKISPTDTLKLEQPSLPPRPADLIVYSEQTLSGYITQNTLLKAENSPYIVSDYLTVDVGVTLVIEAGTVIKVAENKLIGVHGSFRSEGSADNPVIITSIRDDEADGHDTNGDLNATGPARGDWGQIYFSPTSSDSFIIHTNIRYGGFHQDRGYYKGNTWYYGNPGNNNVANYEGTVRLDNASPTIRNSTISDGANFAIDANVYSFPVLQGNKLERNDGNGLRIRGGALTTDQPVTYRWSNTDIVYVITENNYLTVGVGVTLQIDPGITVKMGKNSLIGVAGALKVLGTVDQPVTITSLLDDVGGDTNGDLNATQPGAGDWGQIYFSDTSLDEESIIIHTNIRYGGFHQDQGRYQGNTWYYGASQLYCCQL